MVVAENTLESVKVGADPRIDQFIAEFQALKVKVEERLGSITSEETTPNGGSVGLNNYISKNELQKYKLDENFKNFKSRFTVLEV